MGLIQSSVSSAIPKPPALAPAVAPPVPLPPPSPPPVCLMHTHAQPFSAAAPRTILPPLLPPSQPPSQTRPIDIVYSAASEVAERHRPTTALPSGLCGSRHGNLFVDCRASECVSGRARLLIGDNSVGSCRHDSCQSGSQGGPSPCGVRLLENDGRDSSNSLQDTIWRAEAIVLGLALATPPPPVPTPSRSLSFSQSPAVSPSLLPPTSSPASWEMASPQPPAPESPASAALPPSPPSPPLDRLMQLVRHVQTHVDDVLCAEPVHDAYSASMFLDSVAAAGARAGGTILLTPLLLQRIETACRCLDAARVAPTPAAAQFLTATWDARGSLSQLVVFGRDGRGGTNKSATPSGFVIAVPPTPPQQPHHSPKHLH